VARLKHYVNLYKKSIFVERGIVSQDRMGAVQFKAKFKKAEPAMPIRFRFVQLSETSPYTEAEKTRNSEFKLKEPIGLDVNDTDEIVEATCVGFLPPAGGAVFKAQALAGDKVVDTGDEIETWRRLFFQVFHMATITVPPLQPTFDYYQTLYLELLDVPAGKTTEIPFMENADSTDLVRLVKPLYQVAEREPWVMALVFAHALPRLIQMNVGSDPGTDKVDLPSRWSGNETLTYDLPDGNFLWFGFNPIHDAANGGKGSWLGGDAKVSLDGTEVTIPADHITIDPSKTYREGKGFSRLKIALPEAARSKNLLLGRKAKLSMTLYVADGFSGGFALSGYNLLTVAATAWWRKGNKTDAEKVQVLNHEFGHKLGMVPKGGRPLGKSNELDAPDKLYGDIDRIYGTITPELQPLVNAKGHAGAHCERGVKAKKKNSRWEWSGTPACTMFGATSVYESAFFGSGKEIPTPQKYCSVCAKLVIRQNLNPNEGLPGFTSLLAYPT
jgi:hypothetical protein